MPGEALLRYALAAEGEQGAPPLERADLYRRLTRDIHREIVQVAFPRARALLGDDGLEALTARFLAEGGPATLQYPRVPDDLVVWAARVGHPLADLLHFERLTVAAERHPAEIDGLRAPGPDDALALNPTLQVGSYSRALHSTAPGAPLPPRTAVPQVYLAWRRPVDDGVSLERVGAAVARALGQLGVAPQRRADFVETVCAASAAAAGGGDAPLRAALEAALDALAARCAVVAAS